MYSNNIVNFQESTTIVNACIKKAGNLLKAPRITFCSKVKFQSFTQFPEDHLPHLIVSTFLLLLCMFAAFVSYGINCFISVFTWPTIADRFINTLCQKVIDNLKYCNHYGCIAWNLQRCSSYRCINIYKQCKPVNIIFKCITLFYPSEESYFIDLK